MAHPQLDEQIHHPTRLSVLAFLSGCAEAEFKAVQEHCQVSVSALSKIASALEEVGYVHVRKGYIGKRPRTWLSLTPAGRTALEGHLAALREIAESSAALGRRHQESG